MKNIDYDKYIAGLGDFETEQQKIIKEYLEEQCEKDEALKALYRPEKIKDCYDFIMNVARKRATDNKACIVSDVVFKMARDFYLEVLPTVAETPPEVSAATEKTVAMPDQEENRGEKEEEKTEDVVEVESCAMPEDVVQEMNADAAEDKTVRDEYGFEIFGEEAEEPEQEEEPAETAVEINKTDVSVIAEEIADDDIFFAGQFFNPGDIIDKTGRRLFFKDLKQGMRFIHNDEESQLYRVVSVIKYINGDRFYYEDGTKACGRRSGSTRFYIDEDSPKACDSWIYAIPNGANLIGRIENNERKMFDEPQTAYKETDEEGQGLLFGF